MNGKHLTYSNRLQIEALYKTGRTPLEIMKFIGCSRATIYRELKRGRYTYFDSSAVKDRVSYSADVAQQDYDYKSTAKGAPFKLGSDYELAAFLADCIKKQRYSVDAALYAARQQRFNTTISRTTLYRYLNDYVLPELSNSDLVSGKRSRSVHCSRPHGAPHGRSIDLRPASVDERSDFGDWEMDTVVGTRSGSSNCLLVLTERLTRVNIVLKLPSKTMAATEASLDDIQSFIKSFPVVFRTITVDNGKEFNQDSIEKNNRTVCYHCHPYSSYERGSNENNNRLVRRWIPKGKSMDNVSPEQAHQIMLWMNHYPRGIFGGRCSFDLFQEEIRKLHLPDEEAILKFFG